MPKYHVDPEGATRYFQRSGEALRHADAIVAGTDYTNEADGTTTDHLKGLLEALSGFSKADLLSGIGAIINACLAEADAREPERTGE